MLVLGIETSCDETSVAIVDNNKNILSNIVFSQIDHHALFGGVVPEVAAREHLTSVISAIRMAVSEAKVTLSDLDAIAGVIGPGLYGSLLVGCTAAKSLSLALNKPFIAINHLEAHILTPRLLKNIDFPYLALLISGGHTQFVAVQGVCDYKILGTTLDDALGEAFDKTARLLGFPYPGGKHIETLAQTCQGNKFKFKPPLLYSKDCNLSFSGLKTAVNQQVNLLIQNNNLTADNKAYIAKAFETAILTSLKKKTTLAIEKFKQVCSDFTYLIVSGGVAANSNIRNMLDELTTSMRGNFYAPPITLCGDNAAMVAWSGVEKLNLGITSNLGVKVKPNLHLNDVIS